MEETPYILYPEQDALGQEKLAYIGIDPTEIPARTPLAVRIPWLIRLVAVVVIICFAHLFITDRDYIPQHKHKHIEIWWDCLSRSHKFNF